MTDAPFDTRRLIRDLPDLLAGREPVLGSPASYEHLRRDPVARGMFVAAMEIGSALEGGVAAVRWRGRRIPTRVRRPIERAHRFFRRRIAEVGLNVGFTRFVEQRADDWVYFENADAARPVRGDESASLRRAHAALTERVLDDDERATLAAIDTNDPRKIFPVCRELDPGSSIARYYELLVDPVRSLDPQEWLDLAGSVRDPETIGWALVYAGNAFDLAGSTEIALETTEPAAILLPGAAVVRINLLMYALVTNNQTALESAVDLSRFAVSPQAAEHVRRQPAWSNGLIASDVLARKALELLPAPLRKQIEEVRR